MKLFGSIVFAILSVMVNGQRGNPNAGGNGNPNGTRCVGESGNSGVCGSNSGNDCPNICNALGIPEGRCNGVGNADCSNSCFTCTPTSGGHTGRVRVRTRKF